MNGILVVNKKEGYTSRDIVNKVSKILKIKKIGHTGTLDPLATGVLVLCVGKSTKLVELLTSTKKEYIASIKLGIETDTLDKTGTIIKKDNKHIDKKTIVDVINSMKGTYNQEVPAYSAIKINGKKLYEYARNNEKVELPKRKVTIYNIELISDIEYNDEINFQIKCEVSKGTYIRSLIRDIAYKLNTVGIMTSLIRTKQGEFTIDESYTLEDIENNNYKLLSLEEVLKDIYTVEVDKTLEKKVLNGVVLDNLYNEELVLFKNKNNLLALYKLKDNKLRMYRKLL